PAVDPAFQAKVLHKLKHTGRPVVGVDFDCCPSGLDLNTQQSFQALSERAVAVVVDSIWSLVLILKIKGPL
ncbi:hypothetical protein A6R68_22068, partial [Neotoma lepida]